MLRPERMSKVSVTGAKSVMDDVVETTYDLHRLHLTEYDGSWEGFEAGDPAPHVENASEKLVTVRGLESTLDLEEDDAEPAYELDPSELEDRLAEVRTEVNDLDDARQELQQQLREVEDRIDTLEPFARLGIDLDLLSGYDSIELVVGEGDEDAVRAAYEAADEVRAVQTFAGDGVVAAAVAPAEGVDARDAATDPLVGVEFSRLEIPDAEGEPEDYVEELRHEAEKYEQELDALESELENLTLEVAGFLLAAEEYLSIVVDKGEAPLEFATTDNSFVAEGWIPTEEVDELEATLRDEVGDRIEFEELEQAAYDRHGDVAHHDQVGGASTDESQTGTATVANAGEDEDADDREPAMADGGRPTTAAAAGSGAGGPEPRADGGVVTVNDEPPVVQDNPDIAKSFEVLTQAVNRPKYTEFDPTIILFLTFPLFFGFMIGDIGYGLVYVAIGYWVINKYDSETLQGVGWVVVWAGILTIVFGILYGELFGFHEPGYWIFGSDGAPLDKGITTPGWAEVWLVAAVVAGWIHLTLGWTLDFVENYQLHGPKEALVESGSWLLIANGTWLWIFSEHLSGMKPEDLLFHPFNAEGAYTIVDLGFTGLPLEVGYFGIALLGAGVILLLIGPAYELPEVVQPFVHALSYTRLTAVLLSKAGMALVANLLYFGAYQDADGGYHFMHDSTPATAQAEGYDIVFSGLFHGGLLSAILGIAVLIVGHIVVLAIGGTAAIQAIRLEYVEFFGKFYEGGGEKYEPFGYDRNYTSETAVNQNAD